MIGKITTIICIFVLCKVSHIIGFRNCSFILDFDNGCSELEYCDEETKQCHCLNGYKRVNITSCIKTEDETADKHSNNVEIEDSGSVTMFILTPLLLLIIVISGIYMNRKYHLIAWVKQKMHRNHENYDEFMIGQDLDDDDPPLH